MTPEFGPVRVAALSLSESGKSYSVKLLQHETRWVDGEDNNRFALADQLATVPGKRPVHTKRTNTQTVSLEEGEQLRVGMDVAGHLLRVFYSHPQYHNHQPAYEGGYPLTMLVKDYQPDIDLRPEKVEQYEPDVSDRGPSTHHAGVSQRP